MFAVDGGGPGSFFKTAVNPTAGCAGFVDDEVPPGIDRVERFGEVRWLEEGSADCPVLPRTGGCCTREGCIQVLTEAGCSAAGGYWLGTGIACEANPCGACCYWQDEGNGAHTRACVFTSERECYENQFLSTVVYATGLARLVGPHWAGSGIPCSESPDLPDSAWWCCDPLYENHDVCDETRIHCCLPDGTCLLVEGMDCWDQGGTSVGWECPPAPCTADWGGACCIGTQCVILEHRECVVAGGEFQGYASSCDPDPCDPTAIETTTWGKIRSSFR